MKKFVMLHYGFEKPTPEIMAAWGTWFKEHEGSMTENCGFGNAREISADGTKELPMGTGSITGYTAINAESMDEAEKIASGNPFIESIRIYEVRGM